MGYDKRFIKAMHNFSLDKFAKSFEDTELIIYLFTRNSSGPCDFMWGDSLLWLKGYFMLKISPLTDFRVYMTVHGIYLHL